MKGLLGILLLSTAVSTVQAQVITPEEVTDINQQTELQVKAKEAEAGFKKSEFLAGLKEIFTFDNQQTIPKAQSFYNESESEKIEYIKCVETILQKNKGGYGAPKVAMKLLNHAVANNDYTLSNCTDVSKDLVVFPAKKLDKKEMEYAQVEALKGVSKNISNLFKTLIRDEARTCTLTKLRGSVGFMLAGGAGIEKLTCLFTNGKLKNYVGVNLMVGSAFGAALKLEQITNVQNAVAERKVISTHANETGNTAVIVVLTDEALVGNSGQQQQAPGDEQVGDVDAIGIGLELVAFGLHGGVDARTFNGKRRWQLVLPYLN